MKSFEQIDFLRGRPVLEQRPDLPHRRAVGRVDEARPRVDERRPDLLERAVLVAMLDDQLHRLLRPRKADRLFEGSGPGLRLVRRGPLAEDRVESPRVDDLVRLPVDDVEEILAEVRRVDEARPAAGPWTVGDDLVQGDHFLAVVAGMEVVDAHGLIEEDVVEAGGGRKGHRHDEESRQFDAQHAAHRIAEQGWLRENEREMHLDTIWIIAMIRNAPRYILDHRGDSKCTPIHSGAPW